MKNIRKYQKPIAFFFVFNLAMELLMPLQAYALTGGPSQPEVQSFAPVDVSEMVDPFSGDFSYNLPLLDIDGYPININYNSGVTTDAEASWVGLGWNLNPGVINRSMRGLPDDFGGEEVTHTLNMKPNRTYGVSVGIGIEALGIDPKVGLGLSYNLGINYNNYNGIGFEQSIKPSISVGDPSKGTMDFSLGLSAGANGMTISPTVSFEGKYAKVEDTYRTGGANIGVSFNSRSGLSQLTIGVTAGKGKGSTDRKMFKDLKRSEGVKSKPSVKKEITSGGLGGSLSIGMNSYTPAIQNPMNNTSITISIKQGLQIMGADGWATISGYFSGQRIAEKESKRKAYGYLYADRAITGDGYDKDALMDFNREKDGPYTQNTPSLPLSNFTYDILNVSGQGVAGTYRPFRNDIGAVYDPAKRNLSTSFSGGGEVGTVSLLKGGIDVHVNVVNSKSRIWTESNNALSAAKFHAYGDDRLYEPFVYRQAGELSVDDEPEFSEAFDKSNPVRLKLESAGGFDVTLNPVYVNDADQSMGMPAKNYRSKRRKRAQMMTILRRSELPHASLDNDIPNIYGGARDNHIGEISVIRTDGARYIYGLPAYNISQDEMTFAVGQDERRPYRNDFPIEQRLDHISGLVGYMSDERTSDNTCGTDHFYSNTHTPAYAHSFLLTAILAPDYVDIDNIKGPSDGDIGGYTKFSYKKLDGNYKWRVPFESMKANYSEGFKSDIHDDKASLLYGEKEIWYLEKVITKNSIAIFHTESRKDGFGAHDIDGGINTNSVPMHLLRKISLYSKPDYNANPVLAVPIKEVHFEYDYSLCPNVPNNNGVAEVVNGTDINLAKGKLTLKKLYFTYGTSKKAKFSPYDFSYSSFNPAYGLKNYDRWGNYKSNSNGSYIANEPVHSAEYPYVIQDKTLADQYASAWLLKEVALPSGGKIIVDYESDDYAFVQDKPAMEMVNITSMANYEHFMDSPPGKRNLFVSSILSNRLYDRMDFSSRDERNVLFFPLRKAIPIGPNAQAEFARKYLGDIPSTQLYFRFLVDITKNGEFEYISGYADLDKTQTDYYGVLSSNGTVNNYGWIALKRVDMGDKAITRDVNPIAKATWQFARANLPKKLDESSSGFVEDLGGSSKSDEDRGLKTVIGILRRLANASITKGIVETIQGANGALRARNLGKEVKLHKSFIRLLNPDRKKLGGGCRVTQIKIQDGWNQMVTAAGNFLTEYGKKYNYETVDPVTNEVISSGVAVMEPSLGGDENPLRQPDFFGDKQEKVLAPDDKHYLEFPYGESFYPSAAVGYSKVTVTDILPATNPKPVKRHATGSIVKEFYTARDFPVISRRTGLDLKRKKTMGALKIFKLNSKDYVNVSQGYSVELNDMHGKPKADWVYAEGETRPQSGVVYKYKCKAYGNSSFQLTNDVTVIRPDGSNETREVGVEYDMILDFREQRTRNQGGGVDGNLAGFLAGILPIAIPTVIPVYSRETTRFRSAVATKIIQRYGLLEETVAVDLGAEVPTRNLAYDSETGSVLLTMTKNEFNDDIYTMNYPAHWYYDGMGAAYKNVGAGFIWVDFSTSGVAVIDNAANYFVPGDEVISSDGEKGWVSQVLGNNVTFINNLGLPYKPGENNRNIKIVRSGRRNILSANIGSMVTLVNPLNGIVHNHFTSILTAGVQTFKEGWDTECECFDGGSDLMMVSKNDYAIGRKGVWRPHKSFTYLTGRQHSYKNTNTNIRFDGTFSAYNPYWKLIDGKWSVDNNNWTEVSEVTAYSPFGAELENRDALDRFSAATYGYNHSIPTAVSSNAMYSEIGFDGVEDYDFINCATDHFSYKSTSPVLYHISHTGKKALSIQSGTSKVLNKSIVPCQ